MWTRTSRGKRFRKRGKPANIIMPPQKYVLNKISLNMKKILSFYICGNVFYVFQELLNSCLRPSFYSQRSEVRAHFSSGTEVCRDLSCFFSVATVRKNCRTVSDSLCHAKLLLLSSITGFVISKITQTNFANQNLYGRKFGSLLCRIFLNTICCFLT